MSARPIARSGCPGMRRKPWKVRLLLSSGVAASTAPKAACQLQTGGPSGFSFATSGWCGLCHLRSPRLLGRRCCFLLPVSASMPLPPPACLCRAARSESFALSDRVIGELLAAVPLLCQCDIDLRAKAAPLVVATDASDAAEAGAYCPVSAAASEELYRRTLSKGLWNKLLSPCRAYLREHCALDPEEELPCMTRGRLRLSSVVGRTRYLSELPPLGPDHQGAAPTAYQHRRDEGGDRRGGEAFSGIF